MLVRKDGQSSVRTVGDEDEGFERPFNEVKELTVSAFSKDTVDLQDSLVTRFHRFLRGYPQLRGDFYLAPQSMQYRIDRIGSSPREHRSIILLSQVSHYERLIREHHRDNRRVHQYEHLDLEVIWPFPGLAYRQRGIMPGLILEFMTFLLSASSKSILASSSIQIFCLRCIHLAAEIQNQSWEEHTDLWSLSKLLIWNSAVSVIDSTDVISPALTTMKVKVDDLARKDFKYIKICYVSVEMVSKRTNLFSGAAQFCPN